jgi:predicted ABC-type ATPase
MPELHILAGPNGTGKTTYYNTAIEQGFIHADLSFLNTDNICRDELGGYSQENSVKAEAIVRERMKQHIANNQSFMIESNLAVQADYTWIDNMKQVGYSITLYFLCTKDVEINIARVQKRIAEGGHPIPEAIIRQRYTNGLM